MVVIVAHAGKAVEVFGSIDSVAEGAPLFQGDAAPFQSEAETLLRTRPRIFEKDDTPLTTKPALSKPGPV